MSKQHDGRSTDTRQRILAVAEELYHAGGYPNITFQTIAQHLDIAKPSVFYHFASKQELFFVMLLQITERIHQRMEEVLVLEGISTQEKLRRLMQAMMHRPVFDVTHFVREEMHTLTSGQQQQIMQATKANIFDVIEHVLQEGVERGEFRMHNIHHSGALFLNLCIMLPLPHDPFQHTNEEDSLEDELSSMLDFFFSGILAGKTESHG